MDGQALALKRAYAKAPYTQKHIHFIEGHGTGTELGDRVELEAIAKAMENGSNRQEEIERSCGMTSLKSIIGHTKAAAGIGAFIKTVLSVNRRIQPPLAGFKEPNAVFDTKAKALYPITRGEIHKPDKTLRAGISAMGFGGINCHVTLESAGKPSPRFQPSLNEQQLLAFHQESELFVLTGNSFQEVKDKTAELLSWA